MTIGMKYIFNLDYENMKNRDKLFEFLNKVCVGIKEKELPFHFS